MITRETVNQLKELINSNDVFDILVDIGAEPQLKNNIIISKTVCHEGDSRKLYYYIETNSFYCYTNCGSFDIIELIKKVYGFDFYQAVYYLINRCHLRHLLDNDEEIENHSVIKKIEEQYFQRHKVLSSLDIKDKKVSLPEYDAKILSHFSYPLIAPWLREGMSREAMKRAQIGYYPGAAQITIPHYDIDDRLVGIRGRYLGEEECALYGKYMPIYASGKYYSHPLAFNLYNLNLSKSKISTVKKAIVFEGEKSCIKYASFFGFDNDISVATCGSSISSYQMQLLCECGATEICIAFDRQFQEVGDAEFKKLTNSLRQIHNKYKNMATISFIFDKDKLTEYKDAPIDQGAETFLKLFKERLFL